jgi:hypothetical protein
MKDLRLEYSEIKQLYELAEELGIDARELVTKVDEDEKEFYLGGYRFIQETYIDEIQVEELESDPYILGCFNTGFIADNTELDYEIVQALQEGDKYDALGRYIIDNRYTEGMQEEYARLDGYGHHFASYDGHTHEDILHLDYYFFKVG